MIELELKKAMPEKQAKIPAALIAVCLVVGFILIVCLIELK